MHYHANTNQPGYLPNNEDEVFETATGAATYLADELQRDWDAEYEQATDVHQFDGGQGAALDAIDERYLPAHTELHNATGPVSVAVPGPTDTHLGHVYWVTECHGSCDWSED